MTEIDSFLENHHIGFEKWEHPAVYTTEEAKIQTGHLPGGHVKNLFLRNKNASRFYLLVVHEAKRVDIAVLAQRLEETKLSFGSPEKLQEILCTSPGSVSPFGLIFDQTHAVAVLIDEDLWGYEKLYFHPNRNTATYGIKSEDFRVFLAACGNPFRSLLIPIRV